MNSILFRMAVWFHVDTPTFLGSLALENWLSIVNQNPAQISTLLLQKEHTFAMFYWHRREWERIDEIDDQPFSGIASPVAALVSQWSTLCESNHLWEYRPEGNEKRSIFLKVESVSCHIPSWSDNYTTQQNQQVTPGLFCHFWTPCPMDLKFGRGVVPSVFKFGLNRRYDILKHFKGRPKNESYVNIEVTSFRSRVSIANACLKKSGNEWVWIKEV